MQVKIKFSEPVHNHNGVLMHYHDAEMIVKMDDNGEKVGYEIMHLLIASCKIESVDPVPSWLEQHDEPEQEGQPWGRYTG